MSKNFKFWTSSRYLLNFGNADYQRWEVTIKNKFICDAKSKRREGK